MNSFITWLGGKYSLRNQILKEFPIKVSSYVEVFGGAAWVLFAREKSPGVEVYNDVNHNLVSLFRCIKYHPKALQEELQWCLISREEFQQAKLDFNNPALTDIQRAARFFLLIKCSYGANRRSFSGRRVSLKSVVDDLELFSERLKSTVIEQLDFEKLIHLYDRTETLFYADPPYYGVQDYYASQFQESDHLRLRNTLENVKGKFILTYNDCSFIREMYRDFQIIPIERQNNITSSSTQERYREIIIKNYAT